MEDSTLQRYDSWKKFGGGKEDPTRFNQYKELVAMVTSDWQILPMLSSEEWGPISEHFTRNRRNWFVEAAIVDDILTPYFDELRRLNAGATEDSLLIVEAGTKHKFSQLGMDCLEAMITIRAEVPTMQSDYATNQRVDAFATLLQQDKPLIDYSNLVTVSDLERAIHRLRTAYTDAINEAWSAKFGKPKAK